MSDTHRKHLPYVDYAKRGRLKKQLIASQARRGKSPAADRKAFRSQRMELSHDVHPGGHDE